MNVIQQPFSLLQYSYNYSTVIKKKKPVGNFTVASTSGKLKKNNIPSSSSNILTGLVQQVLAPVGAQL